MHPLTKYILAFAVPLFAPIIIFIYMGQPELIFFYCIGYATGVLLVDTYIRGRK